MIAFGVSPGFAALLAVAACAGAEGPGAPAESPPGGEKGPRTMHVVRGSKAVEVAPGEGVDLVVTRPVGIPEQLQHEWPAAPSIEGTAVRFVRRRVEPPPPDVDGGVTTLHYELEAVAPGTASVTLSPRPASRDAAQPPVVLAVTVRAPGATGPSAAPPSLPEVVARLVETVASSSATPLEIARAFGEVEGDSAGGVYVKPSDARLRRVIAVKRHATGELNDVQLQLAVPGGLAPADLARLWGEPGRPPALSIGETKLVFRPGVPEGSRFRAIVALTLDGDETGPVTWVDVIRDVP